MFHSIIVATDGSTHANDAVKVAGELSALTGATLTLVTIPQPSVDPVIVGYTAVPLPLSQEEMQAQGMRLLDEANALLPESVGDKALFKVLFGDAARAIVEEAKTSGADLIVLGRRGLGYFSGLLIGSTTTKVGQLAPCAVLTVK
jgi:nucleotide-binding universal stress UspA family protein